MAKAKHPNRLSEVRLAKGHTVETLAELLGVHHTTISRYETGQRQMTLDKAEMIAKALEVRVEDILKTTNAGYATPTAGQFAEDAEPYVAGPDDIVPMRSRKRENVDPWRIKTAAVSRAGIAAGQVVFVDISAEAVENVKALQCVIAQIYHGNTATTVVRQYVPPALLITNSDTISAPQLDLERGDAYIKGVIIGSFSDFRS